MSEPYTITSATMGLHRYSVARGALCDQPFSFLDATTDVSFDRVRFSRVDFSGLSLPF